MPRAPLLVSPPFPALFSSLPIHTLNPLLSSPPLLCSLRCAGQRCFLEP
jgi:hypothetical protein